LAVRIVGLAENSTVLPFFSRMNASEAVLPVNSCVPSPPASISQRLSIDGGPPEEPQGGIDMSC